MNHNACNIKAKSIEYPNIDKKHKLTLYYCLLCFIFVPIHILHTPAFV